MYRQTIDSIISDALLNDLTPVSQQTFLANNLIMFADDVFQNQIVPAILKVREEYFVTSYYPLLVGPSTNSFIQIPTSTAAFRVRDLYLYNTTQSCNYPIKAKRINPDTMTMLNGVLWPVYTNYSGPQYYIENNVIKFYPALTANYQADLRVMQQPNHLVSYVCCAGQVLNKLGNNTVQVDNVPQGTNILPNGYGDWTLNTGVNATTIDVLQPLPPYNFRVDSNTTTQTVTGGTLPLINRQLVAVSGNNITLDSDTYNSLVAGDFLVTNEASPFLQYVPFGATNLIKLAVSMKILKAQGDLTNWGISAEMYNTNLKDFIDSLTPKVENQTKKIGGGNRGAILGNLGWSRFY